MDHLSSLFDRALDVVVGMDHRGNVIAWNKAAEDLFGWSREEAIGQSMGDLIVPKKHRTSHSKGLAKYNRTKKGPVLEQRIKITAIDRAQFEFPIELSIFPMHQPNGDIFYAFIRSLLLEEAHRTEQDMRAQEAEVLLAVATTLIEDTSLEEFTRYCLRKICDVAGLDAAHLFYVRGHTDDRRLIPSGIWYVSEAKFQAVADDTARRTFRKGEGLPGQAWLEGNAVVVESIPERKDFIRRASFEQVGLVQGLAVPIDQENKTFAIMEFFGTAKARVDEDVIRLVRTVAKQIGLAIQRKGEAEERAILRGELAHRLGNSLAILSAIFRATAAKATTVSELASSFSVRLHAVARAYKELPKTSEHRSLESVLEDSLELLPDRDRLLFDVPSIQLAADAVVPLSLVFSELVTNHLKHGNPEGHGNISLSVEEVHESSLIRFVWHEPETTYPATSSEGYGSFLVRALVEDKLSGTFSRTFGRDGFNAVIQIPDNFVR